MSSKSWWPSKFGPSVRVNAILAGASLLSAGWLQARYNCTRSLRTVADLTDIASIVVSAASELRVPIIYACNYSLVHKLKKRPPEDRARLLSSPMIMLPDTPDSPNFIRFLENAKVIFKGVLAIQPQSDAADIHSMSFGLRRMVVRLLAFSYPIVLPPP